VDAEEQKLPVTEVCSIRIMFPVTSDEQGIEYKRKISAILCDVTDARIEFSLSQLPPRK